MLDDGARALDESYLFLPAGPLHKDGLGVHELYSCCPAICSQYFIVFSLLHLPLSWHSGSSIDGLWCTVLYKLFDSTSLRHSVKMHYSYFALVHVMHTNLGSKAYSEHLNHNYSEWTYRSYLRTPRPWYAHKCHIWNLSNGHGHTQKHTGLPVLVFFSVWNRYPVFNELLQNKNSTLIVDLCFNKRSTKPIQVSSRCWVAYSILVSFEVLVWFLFLSSLVTYTPLWL